MLWRGGRRGGDDDGVWMFLFLFLSCSFSFSASLSAPLGGGEGGMVRGIVYVCMCRWFVADVDCYERNGEWPF